MPIALGSSDVSKIYLGSSEIDASYLGLVQTFSTEPPILTRLRFDGATSALGGANYTAGQLVHTITINSNNTSSVSVIKTDPSTDLNISNFNNTGTVSSSINSSFTLTAQGQRLGINSAIRGATTQDSVGVSGGNPSKIDVTSAAADEQITWTIRDLDPALTFEIKSISVIRANFNGSDKPFMVLTDFTSGVNTYGPQLSGANVVAFENFGTQTVTLAGTGAGINGTFLTGVSGSIGLGYGIYAIDFDIT